MVRKKLAMAVLALSALHADLASALGLGNLSVKSALNQPLSAEIKLLDTGDLDPSQIKIQLATPEDFERAGVDRNFFLTNLKFTVDLDGRGSGAIRITTHDSVSEPYLNFVVEAKWPNGRLLREFAVLLDPPTFSGGAAQPAIAPRAGTPSTRPTPPPTPAPTRDLQPPTVSTVPVAPSTADRLESNTLPDASSATEHRVQVNETLSQIAAQHKPGDATVQQTMVAIQRANPDAFINSNINLIKSGAVLRLPSADDARAVGAGEAVQQIAAQTHSWRSGNGEPARGPQLDASQTQPTAAAGGQDAERLTIATPGSSDKSTVGEGSGKSTKGLDALRNQLSASQEGLDSAKRDNKELQSRLDDMERQVATLQRLIALKDDQLAAVQAKTAEQGKAAVPAVVPAPPAESAAAQPTPAEATAPEAGPSETKAAEVTPVTPPPVAAAPKPVAKPVAKAPVAPAPSFVDKLLSEPLYWGGALAALALLVGGALVAKKRREEAEEERTYPELDLQDYANTSLAADEDLDTASISDDAIIPAGAVQPFVEAEKKPATRSETGDAIAEADIYIAYGRYQQAVDLLTSAIDAEPDRTDLRVKLLEVFVEMRNRDAFRQQFIGLQSLGDSAAVGQVKEMLSSVDGVSDWLNDLPQAASSGNYAVAGFAAGAAAAVVADNFDNEPSLDDNDLDLELDLDLDDEITAPDSEFAAAPLADLPAEPLEELELDLDLDDDELDFPGSDTFAGNTSENTFASPVEASFDAPFDAPAPTFDPFAGSPSEFTSADALTDLELDEEELDLELNEEDLDFALRAMEGDTSEVLDEDDLADAGAETASFESPDFKNPSFEAPRFEVPSFETASFEAPSFESSSLETSGLETPSFETPNFEAPAATPAFAESEEDLETFSLDDEIESFTAAPTPAPVSDLKDFDLSLAAAEFTAEPDFGTLETDKLDEDLADIDDLSFETPDFETPDFEAPSLDNVAAEEPAVPSFAAPVEPALVPELTTAVGDDFDFLADTDEVATKLDLARAYIDMGDTDGAKDILDEVLQEGSDVQKQEASELIGRIA